VFAAWLVVLKRKRLDEPVEVGVADTSSLEEVGAPDDGLDRP
jgi:hypothetical protein